MIRFRLCLFGWKWQKWCCVFPTRCYMVAPRFQFVPLLVVILITGLKWCLHCKVTLSYSLYFKMYIRLLCKNITWNYHLYLFKCIVQESWVYSHCCERDNQNFFILQIWNSVPIKWLLFPTSPQPLVTAILLSVSMTEAVVDRTVVVTSCKCSRTMCFFSCLAYVAESYSSV